MPLDLHVFRTLSDNAGALLHDPASGACAAVDVPAAGEMLAAATAKGWTIRDVFVTHAHHDHTQGVAELKQATGAKTHAYGPHGRYGEDIEEGADRDFVPDIVVKDGDVMHFRFNN